MERLILFFVIWAVLSGWEDNKIAFRKSALILVYIHIGILFFIPLGVIGLTAKAGGLAIILGFAVGVFIFLCIFIEMLGCLAWYYGVRGDGRRGEASWRIPLLIVGGLRWIIGLPNTLFF